MSRVKFKGGGFMDFADIRDFENRLRFTAAATDEMVEDFQQDWGSELAERLRAGVNPGPGVPVHLRDQIRQVEPGGITMGRAFWWLFLEKGTVNMDPKPFIGPAIKTMRSPVRKDAGERAVNLIVLGKAKGAAR